VHADVRGSGSSEGEFGFMDAAPFYTHTNPQPLTPGEIYRFDIEVLPIAYLFKKGHRIRLEIANGDSPLTDAVFTHPYPPTAIGTDTIHHDGAHPSRLLLPVVKD
jgi:predicted acyl esterase